MSLTTHRHAPDVKRQLYDAKESAYYGHVRHELVALVPEGNHRVLEIGCGEGGTLHALKRVGKAREICGIDIAATAVGLDRFLIADIERDPLPFEAESFDVILCADVLEHLVDPWTTVRTLTKLLRKGGWLVVSLPNFREIRNLFQIVVRGDFRYETSGIRDRTHLRFFCRRGMLGLLEQAELHVTDVRPNLSPRCRVANWLSLGLAEQFLAVQYLLVARKPE